MIDDRQSAKHHDIEQALVSRHGGRDPANAALDLEVRAVCGWRCDP
jgi:hypothetical protein